MKRTSISFTLFLLCSALFICQTAQAQWSQTATTIYPTTLTKKVGIGLNNPGYILHVNGAAGIDGPAITTLTSGGALNMQNVSANTYLSLDGNKIQTTKRTPGTGGLLLTSANSLVLNPYGGSVGVGTSSPVEARFIVQGAVGNTIAVFRGSATGKGIALVGDWPGLYFNAYYNGGSKTMATGYAGIVNFDPDNGRIDLGVTSTAASTANEPVELSPRMSVNRNGNVTIGTYNDHGYKLAVNGKIICEELKVQLYGNWPDYVFADDYLLKPLEELEAHIQLEKHLPGIPAAADIEKNGLEVGNMQQKMMEKIEELTLYVIELNKENKTLQQRVQQLENCK